MYLYTWTPKCYKKDSRTYTNWKSVLLKIPAYSDCPNPMFRFVDLCLNVLVLQEIAQQKLRVVPCVLCKHCRNLRNLDYSRKSMKRLPTPLHDHSTVFL